MPLAFIPDGYTAEGFIAEGVDYPAVQFEYRPMLHDEVSRAEHRSRIMGESHDPMNEAVLDHLVSWDITDAQGKSWAITKENIAALKMRLFLKMWAILAGFAQSDLRPKEPVAKVDLGADLKN
jgi:hypothetical protein